MKPEARWLKSALLALVPLLLLGRWASVAGADLMWASSLGVGEAHFNILRLRLALLAWSLTAASLWCVGNLLLVMRTIGSVQVPRRLANIEIFEAIPRRFVGYAVVAMGALLALALSHNASDWWRTRALSSGWEAVGVVDPILGHDAGYYLFALPWNRTLHGFATLLSLTMLGIVTVMYFAVGAIDINARRIQISTSARRHLGGMLIAVALALFWGYQLEPAEYVAGIHRVPFDTVLTDVRIPTSQLLGALAVLAAISSAMWMVWDRLAVVAFGWVALATFSVTGHYVAPAVALSSRSSGERQLQVAESRRSFNRLAFGLSGRDSTMGFPNAAHNDSVRLGAPSVWDPFALNVFLNFVTAQDSLIRVLDVTVSHYPDRDSLMVPVALGVRDVDVVALRQARDISWEQVHKGVYATSAEVWAVRTDMVSSEGTPVFVSDIEKPASTSIGPVPLEIGPEPIRYTSSAADYAVFGENVEELYSVPVGGPVRRIALSWKLQTARFLRPSMVGSTEEVAWHRGVTERLEAYAPFLTFDTSYPVIVDRRLMWIAAGYVAAEGFPLGVLVRHRGREVRYLRASFLGMVDAHTGETSVFILQDADPLSIAWARLAPELIQTTDHIPPRVFPLLRYPRHFFEVQLRALASLNAADGAGTFAFQPMATSANQSTSWWFGGSPADTAMRPRLRAAMERGDPPMLSAVVDGVVQGARLRFDVFAMIPPLQVAGPSQVAGRVASELGPQPVVAGNVQTIPTENGIVSIQSVYSIGLYGAEPPRLLDVFVGYDGGASGLGRGADFTAALTQANALPRAINDAGTEWVAVRTWFLRLDEARREGRWDDFGEAYDMLMRLFGLSDGFEAGR